MLENILHALGELTSSDEFTEETLVTQTRFYESLSRVFENTKGYNDIKANSEYSEGELGNKQNVSQSFFSLKISEKENLDLS